MLNATQFMLAMLAIVAVPDETKMPGEVVGRYSNGLNESGTRPLCNRSDIPYLLIADNGIDWGDGVLNPLLKAHRVDPDRYDVWIRDTKTGKAILYAVFIDRNYDNAIVISDEYAAMQARVAAPGIHDAGVVGAYARCV